MSSVFSEGFENGSNGAAITTSNTGYSVVTGSGTAVFDNSLAVVGSYSAKFTATGTNTIVLREIFSGGSVTSRYFRRYFNTSALPTASVPQTLVKIRISNTTQAQVVLLNTGKLELKDANTAAATSNSTISLESWFRIEWHVDGTTNATQTLRIFLGSNYNGTTPDETLTASYSGGSFDRVEEGIDSGSFSGTLWLDQVDDDNSTWPGPSTGANTAPVASAGLNQTVVSNQVVTLDGSGSSDPGGGTIAGYAWTQVSGTSVTLSNPTAVQPTFTAPTVTGGMPVALVFGLIVTNNNDVESSQSTVTITVDPPTASAFSEDFENGTNGATITTSNTGYTQINGGAPNPTFDSSILVTGSLSANLQGNGSNTAVFVQTFSPSATSRYMRRYFRVSAFTSVGTTIIRLHLSGNPGATIGQVILTNTGTLVIRDGSTTVATSTSKVTLNTWFRLEWYADGTTTNTQTLQIYLLGNYNGTTPTETISGSFTSGAFNQVEDGIGTLGLTGTMWIDGVVDSTTGYVGPAVGANIAPTANAGTAQSVGPNVTVTLDGSGSTDSDGTIEAYVWSQKSGSAVVLSSATVVQPTFSSPATGSTMVFQLLVIDNYGAGSNPTTVTITDNGATAAFNESFNTGPNGATITNTNTTYSTITGTPVFDNSELITTAYSAKLVSSSSALFMREIFSASVTSRYFRRYFQVTAYPTGANVLTIMHTRLSSTTTAEIVMLTNGQLQVRNATTMVATTTTIIAKNTWYRLEWYIDGTTTNTQTLRVYTGLLLNSAVTPTETQSGAYTNGSFDRIDDGVGSANYVGTMWVDEAQDQTSSWPGPAAGTNQPPIVSAGSSQTVLPGDTIMLDGSGSTDPDGTVASYAWTQTSGTTVTLSSSTAMQPTFTAPALASGGVLVFSLVVTDNLGAQSQAGTVAITVQPANEFMLIGGTWQVFTPNGL